MCILKEVRAEPMFFRVGFFGGFPTFLKVCHMRITCTACLKYMYMYTCTSHVCHMNLFLQNKVYIFRGLELEKLTDFNARLQSTFPFAKVNEATHTVHVKCILLFYLFLVFD